MGQTFSRVSEFFSNEFGKPSAVVHEEASSTHHPDCTSFTLSTYPLATPRSPLCRTKRSSSPSTVSARKPQAKQLRRDFQYLNFAFLKDDFTINFVRKSKVMFIMKGPPGSGKSFISQMIQEVYEDTFVSSADHYFMQHGQYEFNKEKLKVAHEYCQQQAASAARQNIHVIVIDNNNLRHWEMKFYLNLAKTHLYIPVVVEPQTPWAMIPSELAVKNVHNISRDVIANKIKSYQHVQPIYYGWFLNDVDSEEIQSIGWSWFQQALKVQDFVQEFLQAFQVNSKEDLLSLFSQGSFVDGGSVLHATSKFTARGKVVGAKEYITSPHVKNALGKGFRLCIIGFVITTRTIGARLKLTQEQLELWSNDNEDPPVTISSSWVMKGHQLNHSYSEENKEKIKFLKYRNTSVCVPTVTVIETSQNEDRFHPTSGKGSHAHLTLACAPGIKPVNTGFDLILAVRCEQQELECKDQKAETYSIDGGVLKKYGEGLWVVYPNSEVFVSSLFSAFH